jgi:DNA-binding XRE family transcriptional regulator
MSGTNHRYRSGVHRVSDWALDMIELYPQTLNKYGHIIQQRRIRLDMTQTALAKRVGITRNYLSMIERGLAGDLSFRIMIDLWRAIRLEMTDHLEQLDDVKVLSTTTCPHCGGQIGLTMEPLS